MSKQDIEWLAAAMKSYTFDDSDRMKKIIIELKAQDTAETKIKDGDLLELLDELLDLVEMHPRSNLNFCLFGGMIELMSLIFSHPCDNARKLSCSILSSIAQNNIEV